MDWIIDIRFWNNTSSARVRLVSAFLLGFAITGLISYLIPSVYSKPITLGATTMILALGGSLFVRAAFHRWNSLGILSHRFIGLA